MKDQVSVSDKTRLNIPIANFVVIISIIISSVYGFSNLQNRITSLETQDQLMSSDLLKKAEQTPKNLEIFMLIEELFKQTDKQQESIDQNIHTQIKLDHLEEQLSKALKDIEKLKDKVRENGNSHSSNDVSG
ncbi:Fibrinogen-like coiled coil protein [uncultured Mediterranean phage uvMED]|jgi:biopolymer transport protein ExbB/TolQ|nr:Fibrinogen-like coiled coil protein [uncultured Mediterranean phage uvMED]